MTIVRCSNPTCRAHVELPHHSDYDTHEELVDIRPLDGWTCAVDDGWLCPRCSKDLRPEILEATR